MRAPLVKKELREQRPFLALVLFVLGIDLLEGLGSGTLDQRPLGVTFFAAFGTQEAAFLALISFALASGLLMREREDRTLELLDALPVSRARIFATKVAVAWSVLMLYPLGRVALLLFQHALSRTSLDTSWHLGLLGMGLFTHGLLVAVMMSLGLALSFLGRLGWMVLGLMAIAVDVLSDRVPAFSALDPLALAVPSPAGEVWPLPARALGLQLAAAALLGALALALFSGIAERGLLQLTRWLAGPAALPVTVVTVAVGMAALVVFAMPEGGAPEGEAEDREAADERLFFAPSPVAHFQSARYDFSYPAHLHDQAGPVLERADATFDAVSGLLGAGASDGLEPEARIPVDLTGSGRHTLGQAFWNSIRLDLKSTDGAEEAVAALAHETAHVLAGRVAGVERYERLGEMRAFSEGLATWAEQRVAPGREEVKEHRLVAAAVHQRRQLRVMDVLEAGVLQAEHDPDLAYPYGELLVEAMARRYGDAAPTRILRAIAREDAPEGLHGLALWEDTFLAARMDLGRVVEDVQRMLEAELKENGAAVLSLPRPRPAVRVEGGTASVTALADAPLPPGWRYACRFRRSAGSPPTQYDGPELSEHGQFWRSLRQVEGGTLWLQLGVATPSRMIIYEPWTAVPVEE